MARDNDAIRAAVQAYDDAVERYIPGEGVCRSVALLVSQAAHHFRSCASRALRCAG